MKSTAEFLEQAKDILKDVSTCDNSELHRRVTEVYHHPPALVHTTPTLLHWDILKIESALTSSVSYNRGWNEVCGYTQCNNVSSSRLQPAIILSTTVSEPNVPVSVQTPPMSHKQRTPVAPRVPTPLSALGVCSPGQCGSARVSSSCVSELPTSPDSMSRLHTPRSSKCNNQGVSAHSPQIALESDVPMPHEVDYHHDVRDTGSLTNELDFRRPRSAACSASPQRLSNRTASSPLTNKNNKSTCRSACRPDCLVAGHQRFTDRLAIIGRNVSRA